MRNERTTPYARIHRMTRAFFYKPMAVMLAFLMMPRLPLLEMFSGVQPAQAQAESGCGNTRNRILQNICDGGAPTADLLQFENDTVQAYLDAHQIPATDALFIYQFGRSELRNEIRAFMLNRILSMAATPERTPHEEAVFTWFRRRLWALEKEQYRQAIVEYNAWMADACNWKPDAEIAKAHNLKYEGATFCGQADSFSILFQVSPMLPTRSYFLANALKNSYGAKLASMPMAAVAVTDTMQHVAIAAVATNVGAAWLAVVGAAQGAGLLAKLIPVLRSVMIGGDTLVRATRALRFTRLAAGPAIIVTIAIEVGVEAFFKAMKSQEVQDGLAALVRDHDSLQHTAPDLLAFARTSEGLYKLAATLVDLSAPEYVSEAEPPAASSSDPRFRVTKEGQSTTATGSTIAYRDWAEQTWTASVSGAWLVQTRQDNQYKTFRPTFQYLNWQGKQRTASRVGRFFRITRAQEEGDRVCTVNAFTGLTSGNVSQCASYVAPEIEMRDGNNQNVRVSLTTDPAFTSASTATFTKNVPKSVSITATGGPLPLITAQGLPAGFSLAQTGAGRADLNFNGTTPDGTYTVTLRAQHVTGTVTQQFTIIVGSTLKFTSPSEVTFTNGVYGSFTITTAGSGPVKFERYGALVVPAGMQFVDHGNGTATISGVPNVQIAVGCSACGWRATNAVSSATQEFRIKLTPAPAVPLLTSSATFIAGIDNAILVKTEKSVGATKVGAPCALPEWASFTDNGDGTGLLTGKPPAGAESTSTFRLWAHLATITQPDLYECVKQVNPHNFTLKAVNKTVFTSPNVVTVRAGQSSTFPITVNQLAGFISIRETLPDGVTLGPGAFGGATLNLNPRPGTGGTYPLTVTSSVDGTTQHLRLDIYEEPQVAGYAGANFTAGESGSYTFQTMGYPMAASADRPSPLSEGLRVWVQTGKMPAGLTLSTKNENGQSTGVVTIQGTPEPGTEGRHTLMLMANNGISQAVKWFDVYVIKAGDLNASGEVNCEDVALVTRSLGKRINNFGYDNRADANHDGVIDDQDFALVSAKLPVGLRCQ